MQKITYTFPTTAPAPFTGKTFTGGVPEKMQINGAIQTVVRFAETIQGKGVVARIADKPDLAALVAEYEQARADEAKAKAAALEAAVPGLEILREAKRAARDDAERYRRQFNRMMEDEDNDGANPPRPENPALAASSAALAAQYPRAVLYLKAEAQHDNTHWADNTGKGAAGRKAMEILAAGGSIEDAQAAMAERREFVD